MNAIVALLTAASVLAHAALGCCLHHSHASPAGDLAAHNAAPAEHDEHLTGGHCCRHRQDSDHDEPLPAFPHGQCDERDCAAVAGAAPTLLLKAADAVFKAMPLCDMLAITARSANYVECAGLEHDLGPPVRPHLYHRVLLI